MLSAIRSGLAENSVNPLASIDNYYDRRVRSGFQPAPVVVGPSIGPHLRPKM